MHLNNLGGYLFLSCIFIFVLPIVKSNDLEIDPNGYIVFCPCMGRFGNQMDQFLGALAFAKGLDRTLVLPHLVEYPERVANSDQIPFQTYFKPEPLNEYTKVILMDDFMSEIAPKIWPEGNRTVFCYSSRDSKTCQAKEGNPFGPFWDKFKINFDNDAFFGPLGFDPEFGNDGEKWKTQYPASMYPVLAFSGAPGAFPVLEKNVQLQKYLKWSDAIVKKADDFIKSFKPDENAKLIGIHLRNGVDFKRACEHVKNSKVNFFGSAQCLGYRNENGDMTEELCYPSEKTIIKQLGNAIKKLNATYVYIASDDNYMIPNFQKKFKKVKFFKYDLNNPHVDLCILGKADITILNCASTFSAFVKRQRDSENKITEFWAFPPKKKKEKKEKNEL